MLAVNSPDTWHATKNRVFLKNKLSIVIISAICVNFCFRLRVHSHSTFVDFRTFLAFIQHLLILEQF